jgi:hypothetical protein
MVLQLASSPSFFPTASPAERPLQLLRLAGKGAGADQTLLESDSEDAPPKSSTYIASRSRPDGVDTLPGRSIHRPKKTLPAARAKEVGIGEPEVLVVLTLRGGLSRALNFRLREWVDQSYSREFGAPVRGRRSANFADCMGSRRTRQSRIDRPAVERERLDSALTRVRVRLLQTGIVPDDQRVGDTGDPCHGRALPNAGAAGCCRKQSGSESNRRVAFPSIEAMLFAARSLR